MVSNKATMILLSKTDLTSDQINALSEKSAWNMIYSMRVKKAKDDRLQVCFTGFGATEKERLNELASNNKFNVVKSITKKLDFLIAGENAGPKKIEKAELQGVQFLTANQFLVLIQTGEIPTT